MTKDFFQGDAHEVALRYPRVGEREVSRVQGEVIVHQQVDVDGAVVVLSVGALAGAPQHAFDVLRALEAFLWRKASNDEGGGIEELVCRLEAPRLRLDEGRRALYPAYLQADEPQGFHDKSLAVAHVAA